MKLRADGSTSTVRGGESRVPGGEGQHDPASVSEDGCCYHSRDPTGRMTTGRRRAVRRPRATTTTSLPNDAASGPGLHQYEAAGEPLERSGKERCTRQVPTSADVYPGSSCSSTMIVVSWRAALILVVNGQPTQSHATDCHVVEDVSDRHDDRHLARSDGLQRGSGRHWRDLRHRRGGGEHSDAAHPAHASSWRDGTAHSDPRQRGWWDVPSLPAPDVLGECKRGGRECSARRR